MKTEVILEKKPIWIKVGGRQNDCPRIDIALDLRRERVSYGFNPGMPKAGAVSDGDQAVNQEI